MDPQTSADREFHEATAHLYDSLLLPIFGVYYELMIDPILDRFSTAMPEGRAIDIGCGTGGVTVGLAQRGLSVLAVDHSPAMIAVAQRKLRAAGVEDRVELIAGDIRSLPAEDGAIDVATCQGVLHHLDDLEPAVAEMARVLRPGGLFYISEPCEGSAPSVQWWSRGVALAARVRRRLHARPPVDPIDPAAGIRIPAHEEGPVDARALISVLERHGFSVEAEYTNKFDQIESLPRPLQRHVIRWLSRPWRRSRGNLVYLTGHRSNLPWAAAPN